MSEVNIEKKLTLKSYAKLTISQVNSTEIQLTTDSFNGDIIFSPRDIPAIIKTLKSIKDLNDDS